MIESRINRQASYLNDVTITNNSISLGTRLGSMLLDHVFMSMISMAFMAPMIISNAHERRDGAEIDPLPGNMVIVGLFVFLLYFCKDCFQGRSLAKRILGLQVVDIKSGRPASPIQCIIRNLPVIIWPLEVIITLFNQSRRLGDRLAGTELVHYDARTQLI